MSLRACTPCGLAAGAVLAAAAPAAVPPGEPRLRATRPADLRPHPGARSEWWIVRAVAPDGRRSAEVQVIRDSYGTRIEVALRPPAQAPPYAPAVADGRAQVPGQLTGSARRLTFDGQDAHVEIAAAGHRAVLAARGGAVSGLLLLAGTVRGPAALGFDLGESHVDPQLYPRVTLNWTIPAVLATARGRLVVAGRAMDIASWPATYEHGWGVIALRDAAYGGWDSYVTRRGRTAWVAFGLTRMDQVEGRGAFDAMWLGMLARVTPAGMRMCHPRIHRTRWYSYARTGFPGRFAARCAGLRARFADVRGGRDHPSAAGASDSDGRAVGPGGSRGWSVHRVPPPDGSLPP